MPLSTGIAPPDSPSGIDSGDAISEEVKGREREFEQRIVEGKESNVSSVDS